VLFWRLGAIDERFRLEAFSSSGEFLGLENTVDLTERLRILSSTKLGQQRAVERVREK